MPHRPGPCPGLGPTGNFSSRAAAGLSVAPALPAAGSAAFPAAPHAQLGPFRAGPGLPSPPVPRRLCRAVGRPPAACPALLSLEERRFLVGAAPSRRLPSRWAAGKGGRRRLPPGLAAAGLGSGRLGRPRRSSHPRKGTGLRGGAPGPRRGRRAEGAAGRQAASPVAFLLINRCQARQRCWA